MVDFIQTPESDVLAQKPGLVQRPVITSRAAKGITIENLAQLKEIETRMANSLITK